MGGVQSAGEMNSTELIEAFRRDVGDEIEPPLWSDDELLLYAGQAQVDFVRETGGVLDASSELTQLRVLAGEAWSPVDRRVLRIHSARHDNGEPVSILNGYDFSRPLHRLGEQRGRVVSMITDLEPNKVRWYPIPFADETIRLHIQRLPLSTISAEEQEIDDVDEIHHWHLVDGMKVHAYLKSDAETYAPDLSRAARQNFLAYCAQVRAELARRQHKPRLIQYGGL
jgi:hypothetical protein